MLLHRSKLAIVTGITMAFAALGASPAVAAEDSLNVANCFPIGSPPGKPFDKLVADINEAGKGIVKLNMKGGAPAIGSPFTLVQKMSRGVYDMTGCPEAYFGNVLPEAPALRLGNSTFADYRKNGALDMISKLLVDKGVHYVGRHHDFGPFYLFLSKKIDKPDLTGMHLRVSPVYTAFFKSLGATVQSSNISQIYTYMENGTVQGYGWPAMGWVPSWVKVTKYRVEPGFYSAQIHTLVNLKKWKTLSKETQALITKKVIEFETNSEPSGPGQQAALKKQKAWTDGEGMQPLTFSAQDTKKWSEAAQTAGWAEVLERSPEHGPALKKLFTNAK